MSIVDSALEKRVEEGNPIRVGIVDAGFKVQTITYQMLTGIPVVAI